MNSFHWTAIRQRWLETLEQGPAQRGRGVTGCFAMRAGLTKWSATPIDCTNRTKEELTQRGVETLNKWRLEHGNNPCPVCPRCRGKGTV